MASLYLQETDKYNFVLVYIWIEKDWFRNLKIKIKKNLLWLTGYLEVSALSLTAEFFHKLK